MKIEIKESGIWAIVWMIFISAMTIATSLDKIENAIDRQTSAIEKIHN